jgi:hypothetical protein
MLEVGFGFPDISASPQSTSSYSLREGSLNPRSLPIFSSIFTGFLALTRRLQRVILISPAAFEVHGFLTSE